MRNYLTETGYVPLSQLNASVDVSAWSVSYTNALGARGRAPVRRLSRVESVVIDDAFVYVTGVDVARKRTVSIHGRFDGELLYHSQEHGLGKRVLVGVPDEGLCASGDLRRRIGRRKDVLEQRLFASEQ